MTTPFRAETIGSLLRPQFLRDATELHAAGKLTTAEFKRIEDRAVDQLVAMQEGVGLDVVTDGEMRRATFVGPLDEALEGLRPVEGATTRWLTADGPVEQPMRVTVVEKLRRRRSMTTEEFAYARARARIPVKVTVPSPMLLFLRWSPEHSTAAYDDPFEMAADAARLLRDEIVELVDLGCTYVQIDAPEIATLVQEETRDWWAGRGMPAERMLGEGLELINGLADGIDGVRFGLHLCRGNRSGRWMATGGYDTIAEAVFQGLPDFATILLEYDDERAGSFEALRQAPDDKTLVLGLVSTKQPGVEADDAIVARIHEAARHVPLDRLAISTQCGFASNAAGNPISERAQEQKLALVARVAERVWG